VAEGRVRGNAVKDFRDVICGLWLVSQAPKYRRSEPASRRYPIFKLVRSLTALGEGRPRHITTGRAVALGASCRKTAGSRRNSAWPSSNNRFDHAQSFPCRSECSVVKRNCGRHAFRCLSWSSESFYPNLSVCIRVNLWLKLLLVVHLWNFRGPGSALRPRDCCFTLSVVAFPCQLSTQSFPCGSGCSVVKCIVVNGVGHGPSHPWTRLASNGRQ
jgi:hypothetical protein